MIVTKDLADQTSTLQCLITGIFLYVVRVQDPLPMHHDNSLLNAGHSS